MGRSRTMNDTRFIVYKNNLKDLNDLGEYNDLSLKNMQDCAITKSLYIKNCDKKITGNMSSIYQTIVSIYNLANRKIYYNNDLVNIFLLKMDNTI